MASAIVDNINYVARLSRCRREENDLFVVRMTFLGTNIVAPVAVVHPRTLFSAYPFFFSGVFSPFSNSYVFSYQYYAYPIMFLSFPVSP